VKLANAGRVPLLLNKPVTLNQMRAHGSCAFGGPLWERAGCFCVILADEFADIFDGFSIGSNDLTKLILGVDRDSEIVAAPLAETRENIMKPNESTPIICGTDFSENARQAANVAAALATRLRGPLVLVHAAGLLNQGSTSETYDAVIASFRKRLHEEG
jgi:hypothetical protein